MAKILVIDHDPAILKDIEVNLKDKGYDVFTAVNGTDGLNRFIEAAPDIVILEINLPDIHGFTLLEDLRDEDENVKVIMMTADHDMDTTIHAMKAGAFDYFRKPVHGDELVVAIQKALKARDMEKRIDALLMKSPRLFKAGDIIGTSREMNEIFKTIGTVSQSKTTVLIQGESGTGKELIAKVIHRMTSPGEPYIGVNCSAIVETLLESELFGHEKGSFTGAVSRKLGKFELARSGTVFLDEISEMSLNLQAKLLRVLQEMEFERVGGKDRVKVNARIITATNKELKSLVEEGTFRDDLFYRLNVVSIHIPPLRQRKEDITPLIDYLLAKINLDLNKQIIGVSDDVMDIFLRYDWPGNVRELENLLLSAAVGAKGQILVKDDFQEFLGGFQKQLIAERNQEDISETGIRLTLDEVEGRYIRKVIKESGPRTKGEICEILGISRPTFERKLEKYGITFERE
ncbi:MAG: sigma-54 dependent transcriptional regulator [Deltaproteobacteria bacterium]|nr:sigma-54 dependent transcriptional regulator [Deltaproteobacteria bacterium]